ncbi:YraN family protein [Reichenbachiella ulvae]|uniref:UPF0102 protein N7U62_14825 n=1 Tax=Reichenbachiella ulvae TaxID=2980104 RepID=A0ABT3CWQ2_9BACT|nr:YraN family protein [Reichenbachiella ulvae]MCV9387954.1 YraN family protein [Reichenbachiella ulvae]
MNTNKITGDKAERLAEDALRQNKFEILEKNFRYKRAEIDLIAKQDALILFVEVKYRKNENYGYPEEFVSENQQRLILEAADHYLNQIDWKGEIRFDIMAVSSDLKITHFEDAFH